MSVLESWVQRRLAVLLLGMLAGGFAILLVELLLTDHVNGVQLVAVAASVAGLVLTLAAMVVRGRARYGVAALLLVLSATGLLGAYEHFEERSGEEAAVPSLVASAPANQLIAFHAQDNDDDGPPQSEQGESGERGEREGEEAEGTPPPLAPLSLSGLSLMGVIVTLGEGKSRA